MASNEIGTPVVLYIYDLSRGMAKLMAPLLIDRPIEGIWHTSINAYGMEYFFGSAGIQTCTPGSTVLGEPHRIEKLGETFVPYIVFRDYIQALGETSYAGSEYSLINHNCNNFSDEIAQFLCGVPIPKYILDLPEVLLSTPLGQSLRPLLNQLESSAQNLPINQAIRQPLQSASRVTREPSPDFVELNSQIEEARVNSLKLEERRNSLNEKLAKKERKKEKKRRKLIKEGRNLPLDLQPPSPIVAPSAVSFDNTLNSENQMADAQALNGAEAQSAPPEIDLEEQERKEEEERKRNREPPVVFKDAVDVKADFDSLINLVDDKLNSDEKQSFAELHQYMLEDEGSWALGDNFLNFIGRLLHDKSLSPEIRTKTLNILGAAALKDDVILILHQDRREHIIMNFAHDIDRLSLDEQKAVALFFANMFENLSSSEWLMYISEWNYCNQQISNIRITTKVAVHSLLSDDPTLQDRGTAIIHNLATKEVFDDVAVELTMALLQFFNSKPGEEQLFRCMKALAQFTQISGQEVPQLIQMIGPDPKVFKGVSGRIDELIEKISKKLR